MVWGDILMAVSLLPFVSLLGVQAALGYFILKV
jgi:hypothetical protein